jgi:hypothetical protein
MTLDQAANGDPRRVRMSKQGLHCSPAGDSYHEPDSRKILSNFLLFGEMKEYLRVMLLRLDGGQSWAAASKEAKNGGSSIKI